MDPPLGDTTLAPGARPPEGIRARRFRPRVGWIVGGVLSLAAGYAVALAITGSVASRANGSACDEIFAAMQAAPFFGPINGWLTLEACSLRGSDDLEWALAEIPALAAQLVGLWFLLVGLAGNGRPRLPVDSNVTVAPYASSTAVGLDVTLTL